MELQRDMMSRFDDELRLRTALGLLPFAGEGRPPAALAQFLDEPRPADAGWTLLVGGDLGRARLELDQPLDLGGADELQRALGEFLQPARSGRWVEAGTVEDRGWLLHVDAPLVRAQVAAPRSAALAALEPFALRCTRVRRSLAPLPFSELTLALDDLDQAEAIARSLGIRPPPPGAWAALAHSGGAFALSLAFNEAGCTALGVTALAPTLTTVLRLFSSVGAAAKPIDEKPLALVEGTLNRRPAGVTLRAHAAGHDVEIRYSL
jgi:hypothetical protein